MKSILIPVDFSATTQSALQYVADFSHYYCIDEIILLRVYHTSPLNEFLPSPDMVQLAAEVIIKDKTTDELRFKKLVERFRLQINLVTRIETVYSTDKLLPVFSHLIEAKQPEMIVFGNGKFNDDNDLLMNESLVRISELSSVPVLLLPSGLVYQKIEKVLLPTSFENLFKIRSFKSLCKSHAWLTSEIVVLNIDSEHKHDHTDDYDIQTLNRYLAGYNYHIEYSYEKNIPKEILNFGKNFGVQLILALPGKHSFIYHLLHKSITKDFALKASVPVLLLK